MSRSMFQRRHYEAIAADIRREVETRRANGDDSGAFALYSLAKAHCGTFKRDNPNFSSARFLDACGVE